MISKFNRKEDFFQEIIKRTVEAIEKIEKESKGRNEEEKNKITMKNLEEKLEADLKESLKNFDIDLSVYVRGIIDEMKKAIFCCKQGLKKVPITSTIERLFYEKSPQEKEQPDAKETAQVESLVEKLRKIVNADTSETFEEETNQKFCKVHFKHSKIEQFQVSLNKSKNQLNPQEDLRDGNEKAKKVKKQKYVGLSHL